MEPSTSRELGLAPGELALLFNRRRQSAVIPRSGAARPTDERRRCVPVAQRSLGARTLTGWLHCRERSSLRSQILPSPSIFVSIVTVQITTW